MYIHFKKSGNTGTKVLAISSSIMWFLLFYIFILNFMHVWNLHLFFKPFSTMKLQTYKQNNTMN